MQERLSTVYRLMSMKALLLKFFFTLYITNTVNTSLKIAEHSQNIYNPLIVTSKVSLFQKNTPLVTS